MKNNNERIKMLSDSRQEIVWGLILTIFLWWTIVGGLVGIVMLFVGLNRRMKIRELEGKQ